MVKFSTLKKRMLQATMLFLTKNEKVSDISKGSAFEKHEVLQYNTKHLEQALKVKRILSSRFFNLVVTHSFYSGTKNIFCISRL